MKPKFKPREAWAIYENGEIYEYESSLYSQAIFRTRKGARLENKFLKSQNHNCHIERVLIYEGRKMKSKLICPKCWQDKIKKVRHNWGKYLRSRPHMHYYCRSCGYDWTGPVRDNYDQKKQT